MSTHFQEPLRITKPTDGNLSNLPNLLKKHRAWIKFFQFSVGAHKLLEKLKQWESDFGVICVKKIDSFFKDPSHDLFVLLDQNRINKYQICFVVYFEAPLSKSIDCTRHQMKKFLLAFDHIIIDGIDIKIPNLYLKMFQNLNKIKLVNQCNLLSMVHALADHSLHAIKCSILENLRRICLLQKPYAILYQSFKILQLVPVDELGINVQHIFESLILNTLFNDIGIKSVNYVLYSKLTNSILDPHANPKLIFLFALTFFNKVFIEGEHHLNYEFYNPWVIELQ